jgi:hypothetical protein
LRPQHLALVENYSPKQKAKYEKRKYVLPPLPLPTFRGDINHVIQFIPTRTDAYNRFSKAIIAGDKRHIPRGFRKDYISGWNDNCEDLYQEYNLTHDRSIANQLLQNLNDQRKKKWERTVESVDFTHLSRKAWKLLRDIGGDSQTPPTRTSNITANNIATRLLQCFMYPRSQWIKTMFEQRREPYIR